MPVLIVSEKTWPHDGFSRKRSILPSSSVTTIPNSSGFSTDFRPIVTDEPFSLWKRSSAERSMSQSASPEMTSTVSSSFPEASRTDPAVPSGDSSTEYSMFRPRPSPVAKYERIACGRNARVMITSSKPCFLSSSRMCSMQGLPTIGTIGFGWFDVSGRRRVPSPPAITTALISGPGAGQAGASALWSLRRAYGSCEHLTARLEDVLAERDECERETGPEDPERPLCAVVRHHDEPQACVEQPSSNFAEEVHLKLVAAAHHERRADQGDEIAGRNEEREPGQTPGVDQQQHRGVDHQAVGERIGDLPELRLDVPAPREKPVDLVGHARDPEDDRRWPGVAAVGRRDQPDEDRDQDDPEDRERVRQLATDHAVSICRC